MQHNEDKIQELLIGQAKIFGQLERIISDIESEKEVRKRRNDEIDNRLRDLEKFKSKWGGALIALCIIATVLSIATAFLKFKT